ncbi:glycosyl hydrolase family 18 protein [Rarobacter incanus]|uniref:chitinase n=1 Tax=Rarobacter incanus TaxID=153494 RepID=A0A542SS03_9MICO|nr:glycosyl hydrolase family 18 protein [Rarobacter incanus]TQK77027.1 chitinase [Rarobacter incanus]
MNKMHNAVLRALAAFVTVFLVATGGTTTAQASSNLATAAGQVTQASKRAEVASSQSGWLTGYWHNFNNGSTLLKLTDIPQAYNLVAVAFAEQSTTPGAAQFQFATTDFAGVYTETQFRKDIKTLQGQGRKVIISIGGANGAISVTNATQQANFVSSLRTIIDTYGFDGLDIDFENGITAQYLGGALHELASHYGSGFIVTMAPQTMDYYSSGMEYWKLTVAVKDILTVTNLQYYNSGSMPGEDGKIYSQGTIDFLTALAAKQIEQMGLRADQVGLGVPSIVAAAPSGGYLSPSDVSKAIDCLETLKNCGSYVPPRAYGKIGGAMTWSINWDATNGYAFAQTVGARVGSGDGTPVPNPGGDGDGSGSGSGGGDGSGSGSGGGDGSGSGSGGGDGSGSGSGSGEGSGGTTDPGGSGSSAGEGCDSVPAWKSDESYLAGARVVYDGLIYVAKWWTQGNIPPLNLGEGKPWSQDGACSDAGSPGGGGTGGSSPQPGGGTDQGNDGSGTPNAGGPGTGSGSATGKDPARTVISIKDYRVAADAASEQVYVQLAVSGGPRDLEVQVKKRQEWKRVGAVRVRAAATTVDILPALKTSLGAAGLVPSGTYEIRLVARATSGSQPYAAATSRTITVKVSPKRTVIRGFTSGKKQQATIKRDKRLKGRTITIVWAGAGKKAKVQRRIGSGAWKTVKRVEFPTAQSDNKLWAYQRDVTLTFPKERKRGVVRYRIVVPKTTATSGAVSKVLRVRVK